MTSRFKPRLGFWQIFAMPALVALASIVGLVAGLTDDGFRDWLSWALLLVPLAVLAWAWRRRGQSPPSI